MDILIVFDEKVINDSFEKGFGFSCLIDGKILFDTGADGNILLNNLEAAGVNSNNVKKVVISHNHWDHTSGLFDLSKSNKRFMLYVPLSMGSLSNLGLNSQDVFRVKEYLGIEKNVYSTGPIKTVYKDTVIFEQGLVLDSKENLTLLTGCAHPGIVNMVKDVKQYFKRNVDFCIGGFHLRHCSDDQIIKIIAELKKEGVKKVSALHCSGQKGADLFKKEFNEQYIDGLVGSVIKI